MKALSTRAIWQAPVLIGAASAAGLVLALLYDGFGDLLGRGLLGVPIVVVLWSLTPHRQRVLRRARSVTERLEPPRLAAP